MFVPRLEGQLAMPDFSRARPSPFQRSCGRIAAFVARASGRFESRFFCQTQRDPAVFRGVRGGEETAVVAILHVFAVGLQDARGGAGLRENFAQHREIEPERVAQTQALRRARRC